MRKAERVDLSGRRMLVTGCSVGSLGFATAQQLARWGATVIVTTRRGTNDLVTALNATLEQGNYPGKIDGHQLDLSDTPSINQFTQWYDRFYGGRLDVLVNNAGIHLDLLSRWKEPRLSRDRIEIHWRTNYLGTVQLTHNLLPLLLRTGREVGEARIVNVVSQLHSRGSNALLFDANRTYESWQAYGLSKLALMHYTNELHRRYSAT
ncbi:MAG TPA: SDR family NAD(P)-dependent oxidoreductase, partial [Halioglobus sp.]